MVTSFKVQLLYGVLLDQVNKSLSANILKKEHTIFQKYIYTTQTQTHTQDKAQTQNVMKKNLQTLIQNFLFSSGGKHFSDKINKQKKRFSLCMFTL